MIACDPADFKIRFEKNAFSKHHYCLLRFFLLREAFKISRKYRA